jgi:hypothetical protein
MLKKNMGAHWRKYKIRMCFMKLLNEGLVKAVPVTGSGGP